MDGVRTHNTAFAHSKKPVCSFGTLQDKHGLARNEFHRYLQFRSYIDHECKLTGLSEVQSEFFHVLKNAMAVAPSNFISRLYTVLAHANDNNTLYIKGKWERESGIKISDEAWDSVQSFQWSTSSSMSWREHCWKNIIRYFRTPYQERYKGAHMPCWSQCGPTVANHFHIFWECPKVNTFWRGIQASLSKVFNTQIALILMFCTRALPLFWNVGVK